MSHSANIPVAQIFQTEHVQANTHADNINKRKTCIFYSFPFCKITNSMDL